LIDGLLLLLKSYTGIDSRVLSKCRQANTAF